jgi:hypothetical protein
LSLRLGYRERLAFQRPVDPGLHGPYTAPPPFKIVALLERHPRVFRFLDGTPCPPCPIIWFSHPVNKKAAPLWLLKGTRNLCYSAQNVAPCARRGPTTPLSGRQLTLFSHSTSTTLGLTENDKMGVIWDFIKSLAIESFLPKSKFNNRGCIGRFREGDHCD